MSRSAANYSNLSQQEQRAVQADAVLTGVGALATGVAGSRALSLTRVTVYRVEGLPNTRILIGQL